MALAIAVSASLSVSRADLAAAQARARQSAGLTRGAIEDRNGAPLAYTANQRGKPVRRYSLPSLALPVGYQAPTRRWHGVERLYNDFLGATRAQGDWRTFFLNLQGKPAEGGTVRLTLDRSVQAVADKALGNAKGAAVALDPRTGEVLAMVSKPYCRPEDLASAATYRQCSKDRDQPLLDRATNLLLPPGSSFKIVTLSAGIDTGRFHLDQLFSGADAFGPSPYFDNETYPSNITRTDLTQITLAQALAFSDNFTFAHIGLTLGAPTFLRYAHRFYLGKRIPFIYPVQPSVVANGDNHPSNSVLAQSSFGGTTDRVTPLQMALIASTVANRGVMMAPQLVEELRSASGAVTYHFRREPLGRVISAKSAREVTDGMVFVVNHGSGYLAQIKGIQVAGKTGTAASGAYFPHAWFICFAPAYKPVVAVAVLHEFSGEGFKYAAPIARKILVAALAARGYHAR